MTWAVSAAQARLKLDMLWLCLAGVAIPMDSAGAKTVYEDFSMQIEMSGGECVLPWLMIVEDL